MNFYTIRFRYTVTFCSVAVFFIVLISMSISLVSKTEQGMILLGENFNPAISAVINADRDLYQARVAELQILMTKPNSDKVNKLVSNYQENVQQAYDRMQKYKKLLSMYPDILIKLKQFDKKFAQYKIQSQKVFDFMSAGLTEEATQQSEGESKLAFAVVRDFYNLAGEQSDIKSQSLSKETIETVNRKQTVLLVISVIVIILTLLAGVIAPKAMSNSLIDLSQKLKGLNSGDGDLTRRINSPRKDEIGDVSRDIDELFNGLAILIKSIVEQSAKVIVSVDDMDIGAKTIKDTSQKQSEAVEIIVTAVNEMSFAIREVAQNAQMTANEVHEVDRLTEEGSKITTDAVNEIQSLSDSVGQAKVVITKLSENSSDIASVLDVIRGIADQTNLLALNAAIEAARAGEQGRGFAVVADEVRTLASKTQQSTQDIQKMIESLQTGVEEAVQSINIGSQATQSTVDLSKKTLEALDKIAEASQRVSDMSAQTATATEEQSQVAEDVNRNLTMLADKTKENFVISEKNGDVAANAMMLTTQLSDSVTRFKT